MIEALDLVVRELTVDVLWAYLGVVLVSAEVRRVVSVVAAAVHIGMIEPAVLVVVLSRCLARFHFKSLQVKMSDVPGAAVAVA